MFSFEGSWLLLLLGRPFTGLGISKLQWLIFKKLNFFNCNFFSIFGLETLDPGLVFSQNCWIRNTSYGQYRLPLQATMLFPSFIFLNKFFFVAKFGTRSANLTEISCTTVPPEGGECGGDHDSFYLHYTG
jgi:hypothetical protein